MYSVEKYGDMITDHVRMDAFDSALRCAVKPDSVVLDIGTGIGMFALLACQYGARRVYAIEPSDVIEVARELARANQFDDRIEFIQDMSTAVTLPEHVDIIISDLHGRLSLFQSHIPSIIDARERFLSPDGVLIPQSETLWVALVEAPDTYVRCDVPWLDTQYGLDLSAARKYPTNRYGFVEDDTDQLLVPATCWAEIDYTTVKMPDFGATISWTICQSGTAHGLHVWFDTILLDEIGFSNTPGTADRCTVFGDSFFPLLHPVQVAVGDQVDLTLHADLINGGYVWRWHTRILDAADPEIVKADFKQSTLFSEPLTLSQLRKRDAGFIPALNPDGRSLQFALSQMDGASSLEEIARRVAQQFPARYPTWLDALPEVSEQSSKYSR